MELLRNNSVILSHRKLSMLELINKRCSSVALNTYYEGSVRLEYPRVKKYTRYSRYPLATIQFRQAV